MITLVLLKILDSSIFTPKSVLESQLQEINIQPKF